jgi:hypothetical protein
MFEYLTKQGVQPAAFRGVEIPSERPVIAGKFVVCVVGLTERNLDPTDAVDVKTHRSAPSYPDVIPKQQIIRIETRECAGMSVDWVIKAYPPDAVVAEASSDRNDILSGNVLDFKRALLTACRSILQELGCDREYDEEYSIYCISGYSGDPESFVALYGHRIAALLKNERIALDADEVQATLAAHIKYGKDDLTIVDWDGAFLFDTAGDFQSNIELFEIANLQLLRSRILDHDLDERLRRTLRIVHTPRRFPLINAREVRRALREIIEIRTQSLLESVERSISLIGDWYSARLYALVARKFHLDEWKGNIKQKLDALEDAYTMATENFSVSYSARLEILLLIGWFILLILYLAEFLK